LIYHSAVGEARPEHVLVPTEQDWSSSEKLLASVNLPTISGVPSLESERRVIHGERSGNHARPDRSG
jgi:hypothetical protein